MPRRASSFAAADRGSAELAAEPFAAELAAVVAPAGPAAGLAAGRGSVEPGAVELVGTLGDVGG